MPMSDMVYLPLLNMTEEARVEKYDQVKEEFGRWCLQPASIIAGEMLVGENDEFVIMKFPNFTNVLLHRDGQLEMLYNAARRPMA